MDVKTTLLPGQNGTKRLNKKYGDQSVYVRYRHDKDRSKRLKAIELIIDEQDWSPGVTIPRDSRAAIRVEYGETELRELVKLAGGYWNPEKKVWMLSYQKVEEMGLKRRMRDRW